MPETLQDTPANEDRLNSRREAISRPLGDRALAAAIGAFYQGEYVLGFAGEADYRSIVASRKTGQNELVASGNTPEDALQNTLEAMRSLETSRASKPIMHIDMGEGRAVQFTQLANYAPTSAPGSEVYPVPDYLEDITNGTLIEAFTYKKTTSEPEWSQKLYHWIADYVSDDVRGKRHLDDLEIEHLSALTPEQAVKLSLSLVQSLSKYSLDSKGKPDGDWADNHTTIDIFNNAIENTYNSQWQGNGICRNVASNVKAVFEALKANQTEASMLTNTYAQYAAALNEKVYGSRNRADPAKVTLSNDIVSGHAWNSFVTVDKTGSANVTIVDATWAMGRQADGSLREPDYTKERMLEVAQELVFSSSSREKALLALTQYYERLSTRVPGESANERDARRTFVMTEWLKIADELYDNNPDLIGQVPSCVQGAARRLGDRLDNAELQTLARVAEAGGIDEIPFDGILKSYVLGDTDPLKGGQHKADSLLVQSDDLQRKIFNVLGPKAQEYANISPEFRIKLRLLKEAQLPEFDPQQSASDAQELKVLLTRAGFNPMMFSPSIYGGMIRAKLASVGASSERYDQVIDGKTDYQLVRDYRAICAVLKPESTSSK